MKTLELGNLRLTELKADDLNELNGGGWLADWVADVVHSWNCSCTKADYGDPYDWDIMKR